MNLLPIMIRTSNNGLPFETTYFEIRHIVADTTK